MTEQAVIALIQRVGFVIYRNQVGSVLTIILANAIITLAFVWYLGRRK